MQTNAPCGKVGFKLPTESSNSMSMPTRLDIPSRCVIREQSFYLKRLWTGDHSAVLLPSNFSMTGAWDRASQMKSLLALLKQFSASTFAEAVLCLYIVLSENLFEFTFASFVLISKSGPYTNWSDPFSWLDSVGQTGLRPIVTHSSYPHVKVNTSISFNIQCAGSSNGCSLAWL